MRIGRLQQVWQAGLCTQETATRVDLVHQVEALYRRVQCSAQPDGAGIVDQDVDAAELVDRRGHCRPYFVFLADVAFQRQAAPARRIDLLGRGMDGAGQLGIGD